MRLGRANVNPARLDCLSLWKSHLEDAISIDRIDAFGVDAITDSEGTVEVTHAILLVVEFPESVIPVLDLCSNCQHVVFH